MSRRFQDYRSSAFVRLSLMAAVMLGILGPQPAAAQQSDSWKGTFAPLYFWATRINGDIATRAEKKRFGIFSDLNFVRLSTESDFTLQGPLAVVVNGDADIDNTFFEAGASYRLSWSVGSKGETVMNRQLRILGGVAILGATLVIAMPLGAQQPPAPAGTPTEAPTKKAPLRFTAFNVSMPTGQAGVTEITIERWTTAAERTALLGLVATAKEGEGGQRKLLEALQKIKPRVGFIRTPNSLGWDLRYAVENKLDDGTRQIVIATDKPVSFGAAAGGSEVLDYPFTLIEMRMKPNAKGEGKMLAATSILTKNGRLELENYGQEPVRLTSITEEEKKKK